MSEKRKMTFWQKVENFWYYNKWFVAFGVLVVVSLIIGALVIIDNSTDNASDLRVLSAYTQTLTNEEYDIDIRLNDGLKDVNGDGKINATLTPFYITEGLTTDTDKILQSQLEAEFQYCNGDILLFDRPNLDLFLKKDIFAPIGEYLDLSCVPDEDIVYKNDVAVAVKLSGSKILKDMKFTTDEVFVSIMFMPDNATEEILAYRENAKTAIKKLLEKN